jgi:hypothetical protein
MPIPKGFKHSEETKRKISEAKIGNTNCIGRKLSKAHKQKISEANKGNTYGLGYKHTPEAILKIGLAHKGKNTTLGYKHTPETKLKMSLAKKGKPNSKKGIPLSEETKLKMSEAKKGKPNGRSGDNHFNWQGGISTFPYPFDWADVLKESIRIRDSFVCQECGIHQDELSKKLSIHHIDYDKDNLNPSNLISLCMACHAKTNYYRDKWYEYFTIKITNPIF